MSRRLLRLVRFATETATWLVCLGLVRALLVRMPPSNYSKTSSAPSTTTENASLEQSHSDATLVNRSFDDSPDAGLVDVGDFFVCKRCRTCERIDMTILQAASDRVSNILREHRQRVDAGQDPCAKRREARRRRTQELVLLANAF